MKKYDFWREHRPEIEKYCIDHNLSLIKFRNSIKSWGKDDYVVHAEVSEDYNEDAPLPAALIVHKTESGLKFEQTEYIQETLGL